MKLNLKTPPKIGTFLAIAIVALCGGRSAADQEPGTQIQTLDGGRWRLTEWQLENASPQDFDISLDFEKGRISGRSAVNRYMGGYQADGEGSFSTGMLAGTMMAGPEPAMKAEQDYRSLLQRANRFRIVENTLLLIEEKEDEEQILLRFRPQPEDAK